MNRRAALTLLSQSAVSLVACGRAQKGLDSGGMDPLIEEDSGWMDTSTPLDRLADEGPELPAGPPLSLLEGGETELDLTLAVLSGRLPSELNGSVYIVHPQLKTSGPPFIAGEGVLSRINFDGSPELTRKMLRPPCYYLDEATNNNSDGFDYIDLTRVSLTYGLRSLLNTGLVPFQQRLMVTSDAGRPWEVDPVSLELITPIGEIEAWGSGLPEFLTSFLNYPFPLQFSSAHPAVDPVTQQLFLVQWQRRIAGLGGEVRLLEWDGEGELISHRLVNSWGFPIVIQQSIHQIAVTSHHIIVMDTAFLAEMTDLIGGTATQAHDSEITLYVINRSDLPFGGGDVRARKITTPREAAHFIANYDSSNGQITLHIGHQCAHDPSEFLKESDHHPVTGQRCSDAFIGMLATTTDIGQLGKLVIDSNTDSVVSHQRIVDPLMWGGPSLYVLDPRVIEHQEMWWLSFGFASELRIARVEDAYQNYPYREVPLSSLPDGTPANLIRVDCDRFEIIDSYTFPNGRWPSSPTFVPDKGGSEYQGFLVVVVLSDDQSLPNSSGDELWIFDAQDLDQGPLCRLGAPELRFPMSLHTAYMESPIGRPSSYQIDVVAELRARIQGLSADKRQIFESDVFPNFS